MEYLVLLLGLLHLCKNLISVFSTSSFLLYASTDHWSASIILQWKRRASWTNSCWEQKSGSDSKRFHDLLLNSWSVLILSYIKHSGVFLRTNNRLSSPIFSGKFGAFFASIPLPVFAAVYCVLYGIVGECSSYLLHLNFVNLPSHKFICILRFYTAATGISFVQFTNNNSVRNIYILGIALFLGISVPQYFVTNTDAAGHGPVRTHAGWVS